MPTLQNIRSILTQHPSTTLCKYRPHPIKDNEGIPEEEIKKVLVKLKGFSDDKSLTLQKVLTKRETGQITKEKFKKTLLKSQRFSKVFNKKLDLIAYAYRFFDIKFNESQNRNPTRGLAGFLIDKNDIDFKTIYIDFYTYIPLLAQHFIKDPAINVERFSIGIDKYYVVFRVNTPHDSGYKYYTIINSDYYENLRKPNEIHHKNKSVFYFQSYGYKYDRLLSDIAYCNRRIIKSENNSRSSISFPREEDD